MKEPFYNLVTDQDMISFHTASKLSDTEHIFSRHYVIFEMFNIDQSNMKASY